MTDSTSKHSRWRVMHATSADADDIKELFTTVFGEEMNDAWWSWKYCEQISHAFIARDSKEIIAHYAGIKRNVIWQNNELPSVQCVDTMVRTAGRGTLAKRGPYYLTARAFLERYVGYDRPYLFGFGFPNNRVMRLGEKLGIQASVATIVEPVWEIDSVSSRENRLLDKTDSRFIPCLGLLWERMKYKFPDVALCVRDSATLIHRYLNHPHFEYIFHVVLDSDNHEPVGAYVLRNEGPHMLLLDLIGDPEHYPYLVECAKDETYRNGLNEMHAWVIEANKGLLGNKAAYVHRPDISIPTSICTNGPSPSTMKDKWWLMAGDTDFK